MFRRSCGYFTLATTESTPTSDGCTFVPAGSRVRSTAAEEGRAREAAADGVDNESPKGAWGDGGSAAREGRGGDGAPGPGRARKLEENAESG
jgi:hypothetical protein